MILDSVKQLLKQDRDTIIENLDSVLEGDLIEIDDDLLAIQQHIDNNNIHTTKAAKDDYDYHVSDASIHVTPAQKALWTSAANGGFSFNLVNQLPTTGEENIIYLVPNGKSNPNSKDEYIWIDTESRFEKIGNTDVDLEGYATIDDIPTKLQELSDDSTHRLVTDSEKATWNAKPDVSDIPTKTSDLINDSGFVGAENAITEIIQNGSVVEIVDGSVDLGDPALIDDYSTTFTSTYSSQYITNLLDSKFDKESISFADDDTIEDNISEMFGYN